MPKINPIYFLDITKKPGAPDAVKTSDEILAENKKMRNALEEIIEKVDKWRTEGTMEHWQYSQLFDIADGALATSKTKGGNQ